MDDLDSNCFWAIFKNSPGFQVVEKKNGIVCVPANGVIKDGQAGKTRAAHMFIPSPFFQGVYQSVVEGFEYSVALENGMVSTEQGFSIPVAAKILDEEMCYGAKGQYRILILEKSLLLSSDENAARVESSSISYSSSETSEIPLTLQQSENLLDDAGYGHLVQSLYRDVEQFCSSYLIMSQYLSDAAVSLRQIYDRSLFDVSELPPQVEMGHACAAIENIVLVKVEKKVFPAICQCCQKQTDQLSAAYRHQWSAADLDISWQLPPKGLPKTETLQKEVEEALRGRNGNAITSDDLIPLMALAISSCRYANLYVDFKLIELFHWSSSHSDQLSFALATVQAAAAFLVTLAIKKQEEREEQVKVERDRELAKYKRRQPSHLYTAPSRPLPPASEEKERIGGTRDSGTSPFDELMDGSFGQLE